MQDINDAQIVAAGIGIPHQLIDFTENFAEHVIKHFINSYAQGATPNPCISCNRYIKFNLMLLRAKLPDFEYYTTGHYARIEIDSASGRFLLRKALDSSKDQSYVLYTLNQEQMRHICFPLGGISKENVREIAERRNLITAIKNDSQDICFVPDSDYGSFIESYAGKTWPPGDIIDPCGKILGRHRGLIRYTIGQRRGLGVAANIPLYVTAKSIANNTVTLSPDSGLYNKSLDAADINLIACGRIEKPMRVMVKTRYLQMEQPAIAEQTGENSLHIEFDKPQRAITPGQAVVMYDGDIVIGGGTIV
jgi:tRNA-specific 2-thiouridylase